MMINLQDNTNQKNHPKRLMKDRLLHLFELIQDQVQQSTIYDISHNIFLLFN